MEKLQIRVCDSRKDLGELLKVGSIYRIFSETPDTFFEEVIELTKKDFTKKDYDVLDCKSYDVFDYNYLARECNMGNEAYIGRHLYCGPNLRPDLIFEEIEPAELPLYVWLPYKTPLFMERLNGV